MKHAVSHRVIELPNRPEQGKVGQEEMVVVIPHGVITVRTGDALAPGMDMHMLTGASTKSVGRRVLH